MEALLVAHLSQIDRIVASLARRHAMQPDDAEDFGSWVRMQLMENDYAVFRKFRGDSSLSTYLTVVIAMLLRDYRAQRWGRWRPSAEAKRQGPVAVRLETLVNRDGMRLEEAFQAVRSAGLTDLPDRDLAALWTRLPVRSPARLVESDVRLLDGAPAPERADVRVVAAEINQKRRCVDEALKRALEHLPPEDRLIVRMRFWEGLSVANIARGLGVPQKPLYRRIERALGELRRSLESAGVAGDDVQALFDGTAS